MKFGIEASPNIAFTKYWGKVTQDPSRVNWGLNPSFSMTLSKAHTRTFAESAENFSFKLNGSPAKEKDIQKAKRHLEVIEKKIGESIARNLSIESWNNFPTAAGIASSASGFAALTGAVLLQHFGQEDYQSWTKENGRLLSEICRLGSGSACRSVNGPYMLWRNEAADPLNLDLELYDTIVMFSTAEKSISSRDGHRAASTSPLLAERLEKVEGRMEKMIEALEGFAKDSKQDDFSIFGRLLEEESDEMHNLTRQASNPIEYWTPATRSFVEALQEQPDREFFYTIDAGPNVHLISARPIRQEVESLLKELKLSAEIWEDKSGRGPRIIKQE